MKMKVVIILQNPWAKGSLKQGYHPSTWKKEFLTSRTGKRLKRIFGDQEFSVINANPTLTNTTDGSWLKPKAGITARINKKKPDLVVICGKLAFNAVDTAKLRPGTKTHVMRHPAFRLFSRDMERKEAREIEAILQVASARFKPTLISKGVQTTALQEMR
ncbi:MAG: hypothetical protein JRN21_09450 [Nitrososphaerota archaeon]|nr:hypothetical protein [Nitrososphaerota archaeon]